MFFKAPSMQQQGPNMKPKCLFKEPPWCYNELFLIVPSFKEPHVRVHERVISNETTKGLFVGASIGEAYRSIIDATRTFIYKSGCTHEHIHLILLAILKEAIPSNANCI